MASSRQVAREILDSLPDDCSQDLERWLEAGGEPVERVVAGLRSRLQ